MKTITISDKTYESIKDQIESEVKIESEVEQITIGEKYPIAMVTSSGDRLILNLPDRYLSKSYQGCIFSIGPTGQDGFLRLKDAAFNGWFYAPNNTEKQIFPV